MLIPIPSTLVIDAMAMAVIHIVNVEPVTVKEPLKYVSAVTIVKVVALMRISMASKSNALFAVVEERYIRLLIAVPAAPLVIIYVRSAEEQEQYVKTNNIKRDYLRVASRPFYLRR
jgi:hypothetical protein